MLGRARDGRPWAIAARRCHHAGRAEPGRSVPDRLSLGYVHPGNVSQCRNLRRDRRGRCGSRGGRAVTTDRLVTWQAIVSTPRSTPYHDSRPTTFRSTSPRPHDAKERGNASSLWDPRQVSPERSRPVERPRSSSNPLYNPLGGHNIARAPNRYDAQWRRGSDRPQRFHRVDRPAGDGTAGIPLGSGSSLTFKGSFINTSDDWITNFLGSPTVARQLYGFSNVLTVPFPAPAGPGRAGARGSPHCARGPRRVDGARSLAAGALSLRGSRHLPSPLVTQRHQLPHVVPMALTNGVDPRGLAPLAGAACS